jgi:hypothetical protein
MVDKKPKFTSWLSPQTGGKFSWTHLVAANEFLQAYGLEFCDDYDGITTTWASENNETIVVLIKQESGGWRISTVDNKRMTDKELKHLFDI